MTAKHIVIAAGGTAGHINPAIALAEELRDRGIQVSFVGQSRKLEGKLVPEAGFDFTSITVTGFDRSRPWTAVSSVYRVWKAKRFLASHFKSIGKPDAAIGFGAYVEVPLLGWCKDAGVPYVLHEQNSVPGLANKMMSSHAARVCISVPSAAKAFSRDGDEGHVVLTGNPVRRSVIAGDRVRGRAVLGVPEDATLLLVFGGSLGAKHLNERVAIPPSPTSEASASNCGFTSVQNTPESVRISKTDDRICSILVNDTSQTARSAEAAKPIAGTSTILVRSSNITRESWRKDQSNWARPTSTEITLEAPRLSKQSVKPPVEHPISRQRSP